MTYQSCLEEELRKIILESCSNQEEGSLICTSYEGVSSGIPGAWADFLEQWDPSGIASERFHCLVAELIYIVRRDTENLARVVEIQIHKGSVQFEYSE